MSRTKRYDLVLLGGGTGGLVAALIAAGTGARVALVEHDRTGGDCLWTGCVPSKSLIAAANLQHEMAHAERLGLTSSAAPVDLARVMEHVRSAQAQIAPHDSPERLEREGVTVVRGTGRFVAPGQVAVGEQRLRYRSAIVATGSEPVLPPVDGLADADPLTNETVWDLHELPARLVVVGAGPIGCELGQAFARLGSQVTIVDMADRVLPREEPDASALLAGVLEAEGIDLRLDASLERVVRGADGLVTVSVGGPRPGDVVADRVLVAAGRRPRTADLGLDTVGVELDDDGSVRVDATMRTTGRRIFAVGDVAGQLAFTHVAALHARVATLNALFGLRRRADRAAIPWVTFTDPEVAHVGLTEAQARAEDGDDVVLARAGYDKVDRAVTAGQVVGSALLVGDKRGRLVGATLVGRGAGESIAELTAWIEAGEKLERVSQTVHAYPTYAEASSHAADEHLREKFNTPTVRRALKPVLALARVLAWRR